MEGEQNWKFKIFCGVITAGKTSVGAAIDTAQMVQIIKYAKVFYCKRFILEKESRISALVGEKTTVIDAEQSDDIPVSDE